MAEMVDQAICQGKHALLEAGTGCGKTMAYLIPLLHRRQKAVISTGTIALQTQLVEKDLVFLSEVFPRPFQFALAKGRGNYLCPAKLVEADRTLPPTDPNRDVLRTVSDAWNSGGWSGDVAELPFTVPAQFWSTELANSYEECSGSKCVFYSQCPFIQAKRLWDQADLVVANHALYFMHLATGGAVLPHHDIVVFDEAHHLESVAQRTLAVEIGRHSAHRLLNRVQRYLRAVPQSITESFLRCDQALFEWVDAQDWRSRRLTDLGPLPEIARSFVLALNDLEQYIKSVDPSQFTLFGDTAEAAQSGAQAARETLLMQATSLKGRWQHFMEACPRDPEWVHWLEADPSRDYFALQSSPLYAGNTLAVKLWPNVCCILTSATLAVGNSFDFIMERLGLSPDEADAAAFDSPFDYRQQALLYLPRQLPDPNTSEYSTAITEVIEKLLYCTSGRAFVLFTSYKALREVYQALSTRLPFPSKSQEELPRGALLDWFRSTPNSVLFATASFWEGIDVPGQALSCVIIDRLPFTHPEDPIHQATVEAMKESGRDWFRDYALPKAILSLRQGFGRLIRTQCDRGIVAILDPRVTSKHYGRIVLASLPPARVVRDLDPEGIRNFLHGSVSGKQESRAR
ncbi:MAG: ATP-dependent DNA helicase [Armatimonadota bacterium]